MSVGATKTSEHPSTRVNAGSTGCTVILRYRSGGFFRFEFPAGARRNKYFNLLRRDLQHPLSLSRDPVSYIHTPVRICSHEEKSFAIKNALRVFKTFRAPLCERRVYTRIGIVAVAKRGCKVLAGCGGGGGGAFEIISRNATRGSRS